MAKTRLQLCEDALQRLIDGTPKNPAFIGQTITNSLVSKEGGQDPGYLKNKRLIHKYLTDEIAVQNKKQKKEGLQSKNIKLEAKLEEANLLSEKYKEQGETFLTSAIELNEQVFKLENQILQLKKLNKLK